MNYKAYTIYIAIREGKHQIEASLSQKVEKQSNCFYSEILSAMLRVSSLLYFLHEKYDFHAC
jgi:hypothetical protein